MELRIRASTGVYCIIGYPIAHSLSPVIHNYAFRLYGIDAVYVAFEVRPEMLEVAVNGIRALGIKGLTVTIPHKERIVAYLDYIDDVAKGIGAVNTVKNEDGRLLGYNTDVWGFLEPLKPYTSKLKGGSVLLIGAGGAARAIVYALKSLGVTRVYIANRTADRGLLMEKYALSLGLDAKYIGFDEIYMNELSRSVDLIVNATPLGMHGVGGRVPIGSDYINKDAIVYDIVYNPLETPLLMEAKKAGAITIPGIEMLVFQAILAFEIWTGIRPEPKPLRDVVIKALKHQGQVNENYIRKKDRFK